MSYTDDMTEAKRFAVGGWGIAAVGGVLWTVGWALCTTDPAFMGHRSGLFHNASHVLIGACFVSVIALAATVGAGVVLLAYQIGSDVLALDEKEPR